MEQAVQVSDVPPVEYVIDPHAVHVPVVFVYDDPDAYLDPALQLLILHRFDTPLLDHVAVIHALS